MPVCAWCGKEKLEDELSTFEGTLERVCNNTESCIREFLNSRGLELYKKEDDN